jgi:hypothetical protein
LCTAKGLYRKELLLEDPTMPFVSVGVSEKLFFVLMDSWQCKYHIEYKGLFSHRQL